MHHSARIFAENYIQDLEIKIHQLELFLQVLSESVIQMNHVNHLEFNRYMSIK